MVPHAGENIGPSVGVNDEDDGRCGVGHLHPDERRLAGLGNCLIRSLKGC